MVDYTEVATEMNGAQPAREPDPTPVAAQPAPAAAQSAPAAAAAAPVAATPRRQTAPSPAAAAPAAAVVEPAKPATQPQGMAGMQGGMKNIMQMIFQMIAQMFGINMTAMQQAQANPAKPVVATPDPSGPGLKPTTNGPGLNPNAPTGPGLKVSGANPQPAAADKPEVAPAGATKPGYDPAAMAQVLGADLPEPAAPASADPLGDFIAERGLDKPDVQVPDADKKIGHDASRDKPEAPKTVEQRAELAGQALGYSKLQVDQLVADEKASAQRRENGSREMGPLVTAEAMAAKVTSQRMDDKLKQATGEGPGDQSWRIGRDDSRPAPSSLRTEYNKTGAQTLPPLQERLFDRANRITEYTDAGMSLRDASKLVGQERRQELAAQGMDRNTINAVAGGEDRIERDRITQIEQQQRTIDREQRQQQQQEASAARRETATTIRNQRAADRENERDGRALGNVAADLGGLRGNERRMAQALGGIGGKIFGAMTGDDRPSSTGDRENGRLARDVGSAAGGGTYGRAAEILVRRGGEVVTYPQQDRSGMPQPAGQNGKWDSNQITAAQRFSAAYGASPEERQQLLVNQGLQNTAPQVTMADSGPAANTENIRRVQATSGLYSPG
ncbi:MAG: hypothetical protein NDJ24_02770 [Alphaproteobacteria bacterium]|nr:hypothetical protein [Alphaproteobacteria bacterium]